MLINWLEEAKKILPEMTAWREYFHKNAEIGNHEFKTSEKIEFLLNEMGISTKRICGTAIVGLLEVENSETCIALRSDMDALAVKEETGLEFSSRNDGFMHACGHDMHIAAVLGAAKILSLNRDKLKNSVKFLFQPDEEGDGGAQRMVEAGCLKSPEVSAVFGAHVSPDLPAGCIGVKYGAFYANSNPFNITFNGKSAHAAEREKGNDALAAAALFVKNAIELNSTEAVVTVGSFYSGKAGNVIADKADLVGTIRTLSPQSRKYITESVRNYALEAAAKFGATSDIDIRSNYIGITNHNEAVNRVLSVSNKIFGDENVKVLEKAIMLSEDFGYFIEHNDGCFYQVGVGGEYPLHSCRFAPDSSVLCNIAALHSAISQE